MPTSPIPDQDPPSSVQHKREADQRELQLQLLLDAHRPMELLDDMVVAIIDQTYGALLEILGLAVAPPEGRGPVKVSEELVDAADPDPDAPPTLCVVEASARHCCISLIDGSGAVARECKRYTSLRLMRHQLQTRRATVSASPGKVHLARRFDGGGGEGGQRSWKCAGLVGVLETIASHLDTAIQVETGMIALERASGCGSLSMIMKGHGNLREVIKVRMALLRMRREVDLGAIMRRKSAYEKLHRARRPAAEMDVDQVDKADVLTKRLKAMHV